MTVRTRPEVDHITQALKHIADVTGLDAAGPNTVSIEGTDPVLRTRYRIGTAAAASNLAVGLASAHLHAARGGKPQQIAVNVHAAAASLRGNHYLTIDGATPKRPWDDMSGFYRVKDGRTIFLHCNFPNLRDRAAGVLGVAPIREEVAEACLRWEGEELENVIHEAGGCAGYVRTPAEWQAHPHYAAVKAMPLMEIIRIGDAPAEPLAPGRRPLAGVRALDLTRVIAGPHCSRTLAEHGAEVLKISRPDLPDSGMLDLDSGMGKRSTYLDFRDPEQRERLEALVRSGDVFVQSYRPGSFASHGFGFEDLAEMRPGIVVATLSAWGHEGPWRHRRGYDTVVQSATGMASVSAMGMDEPAFLPVSALDYIAGNLLACGVMVALRRRAETGGSWLVRISLVATQHWLNGLGLFPESEVRALPTNASARAIEPFMRTIQAPAGNVRYLGPVVTMSATPPGADRPAVPLGSHAPEWLQS